MWLYEFTIGETVLFVHPDWVPFRGVYDIATQYVSGDFVSYYNGSFESGYWYFNSTPSTGNLPTDGDYWGLASSGRVPSEVREYNMAPVYFLDGEQRDHNRPCVGITFDMQYIYVVDSSFFYYVDSTIYSKHGVVRVNRSTMASDLFAGDAVADTSYGGSADTEFASPYGIILINYNERAPRLWSPFAAGRP